jgi:hypothetical protein
VTVAINDAAMTAFLNSTVGPVGIDIARRASLVEEHARLNASGPILGIDTGDLLAGLHARIDGTLEGPVATVGSPSRHRGFAYPTFHDQTGRPWLTEALRAVFL